MHRSRIRKMTKDAATVPAAHHFVEPLQVQVADFVDDSHQRIDIDLNDLSNVYLTIVTDRFSGCIVHFALIAVDIGAHFRSGMNPLDEPNSRQKPRTPHPATPWAKGTVEGAFRKIAFEPPMKARLRPRKPASHFLKRNKDAV